MMKRIVLGAVAALAMCGVASTASAGVYADDLGKCLVRHASPEDRTVLVQWIFAAMAVNPAVQPIAKVSPEQHVQFDKAMAQLVSRLLYQDCRAEAVDALKNEGVESMEGSFKVFGEASMQSLMNDKNVNASLVSYAKDIDMGEMVKLLSDAGIATKDPKSK